ncbi:MAG: endonuclease/exonuclease/phosphatase family protein, partial [Planctomycetota bacterium]
MRVATFNANSIRSRFNVIAKWLQLHQPDILAVQETKVQDADFPVSDFD